jgi:hypothetical protein
MTQKVTVSVRSGRSDLSISELFGRSEATGHKERTVCSSLVEGSTFLGIVTVGPAILYRAAKPLTCEPC